MDKQGKFIVIEGIDGAGKTTQLGLLKTWLEEEHGKNVETLDFPQYGEFWGKLAGRFLNGEFGELDQVSPYLASLPYFLDQASRAGKIRTALEAGKWVLSNRYLSSSLIHQTSRIAGESAKADFRAWLTEAAYTHAGLFKEDAVIALYVDPAVSIENARKARERKAAAYAKDRDIAEENFQHFIDTAAEVIKACELYPHWRLVDCMEGDEPSRALMSIDQVQQKVRAVISDWI